MARLADWEVATLVARVDELAVETGTDERADRLGAAADRGDQRALRGAADLRLAPAPRRRGRPGRGAAGQRGGPQHRPADGRVRRHRQLHRALQPAHRGADRRPRRALRVALRRRRRVPARPDHQEHRRLGAVRERRPDPGLRHRRGDHQRRRPRRRGCPTSGSAWRAASVVMRLGDVFGPPVNLAARLTAVARRNRIIIDAATAELLPGGRVRDPAAARPGRCAGSASSSRSPSAGPDAGTRAVDSISAHIAPRRGHAFLPWAR